MVMLGLVLLVLEVLPLTLPSFATPQFQEFFRLGRVLRTTLPTSGKEEWFHLVVVYGYQGAEEDAYQLLLIDKLLQAVLAEAQAGFVLVSLCFLLVILNADPAVYPPVFLKGISGGWFVDLALAFSLGCWSCS